jgi:hypothetical protein
MVDTKSGAGEEGIQTTSFSWNCFEQCSGGSSGATQPMDRGRGRILVGHK